MAERTEFAAGDHLTRYEPEDEFALRIDSPFEKPDWKARTESHAGIFPGTTILLEGEYFEVHEITFENSDSPFFSYFLKPWDFQFPIRVMVRYTREECVRQATAHEERARIKRVTTIVSLLAPLVGMLPAELQRSVEKDYGIPATRCTFLSAFILMILGVFGVIQSIWLLATPRAVFGPQWMHFLYPAGLYFLPESLIRIFSSWRQEEPLGTLPVALPVLVAMRLLRPLSPEYQQLQIKKMQTGTVEASALFQLDDQVISGSSEEYDLEIVSVLPKDHWSPGTGIEYSSVRYELIRSWVDGEGKETRYHFGLKAASEGDFFRTICKYSLGRG